MKWSTAEARDNLSRVIHEADKEPQVITSRGRPIAVVIDVGEYEAFRRWRDSRPSASLAETLDELARVCREEDYELVVPSRRDRPNPMAEGVDEPG
ncbi:MAG: type II toxin-antitoxin system prevent-host-death family antitoxin [Myxococcales bacterium]|nr:type II toxin-antitoxin system prevent-host-death family antitoxin [Myxococcales bacterium]MCB9668101.1 type II toxin-antitoxin system prevent-host-death family antitoxin [Alphaproteobacteria bacterium]MCB9694791.1 type II toxin-antitoxin system prevent-host-death family antitoxin [Alphaproteobacteria bacterium]